MSQTLRAEPGAHNGVFWDHSWEPKNQQDWLDMTIRALRGQVMVHRPVEIVPVTLGQAKAFVEFVHTHLPRLHAWKYGTGLRDEVSLIGVVVVGRPVARALDDGTTLEIVRCCLMQNAPKNAASQLLGRACRIAKDLGYQTMITYTLADETGVSLKAAGFQEDGQTKGGQWDCESRPRRSRKGAEAGPKTRWSKSLVT